MEFFTKTKAVKLKSHLNKYLIAGDDQTSTRQSSSGDGREARWLVELVDDNPRVVRLKSCHSRYLTASNEPFLLGLAGHKVLQTLPENHARDPTIQWEPIRDGFQVRLRGFGGKYLRANGGTPPWRNSVTHDSLNVAATQRWSVWDVEAVEVPEDEAAADYWSMVSSLSSVSDEISCLELGSPVAVHSSFSGSPSPRRRWLSMKTGLQFPHSPSSPISRTSGMDLFRNAKSVRLKSSHDKYLIADDDEESVRQDRSGSSKSARWTVEFVENSDSIIRLKSCFGKYLTASNHPFLLGVTGRKVLQTLPKRLDSSVEWEPIREHGAVKLKTRYGQFLRANGGLPPWRNSVTHDIPHRTATQDWVCWEVHVVEIPPAAKIAPVVVVGKEDASTSDSCSPTTSYTSKSASFSRQESNDSFLSSPPKGNEGRSIYFHLADECGEVDEGFEELCITFKGNDVNELAKRLDGELGTNGLTVCTRSPLNGKFYPLRLQLPPNNATMHVVVVPPSSNANQESDEMVAPL